MNPLSRLLDRPVSGRRVRATDREQRPLGQDCGHSWCNSDHVRAERDGIRLGCHTNECMIFLPSGCCTCRTRPTAR